MGKVTFQAFGRLIGLIGGVAILATSVTDHYSGLIMTGIITIIMGIGTILFTMKI